MDVSNFFVKRPGTTDLGKDFEDLVVSYLSLKYLTDKTQPDFFLSSNNQSFGSFDDIIIEIDANKRFALQLKHVANKDKSSLPTKLSASSGNFSISKYFQDYTKLKISDGYDFILFTNYKLVVPDDGLIIKLAAENIEVKIKKCQHQLNIFNETNYSFSFEVVDKEQGKKYDNFFKHFYVFANEPDCNEIEKIILEKFLPRFGEVQLLQYWKFIQQWSKREGGKEKLNREFLSKLLVIHMLSHAIKPFLPSYDSQQAELLRRIITKFNVTTASAKNVESVQKLWGNFDNELGSIEEINKTARKFYLLTEKINDFRQLNNEIKTKLLWLENKYPIIVPGCKETYEIIKLCSDGKYIVLTDDKIAFPKSFQNLTDLEENSEDYQKLLKTFHCVLKNQRKITLQQLLALDKRITHVISTNHIIQMVYDQFLMGDVVTLLVVTDPHLNSLYQKGYPPIHVACLTKNLQLVKLIVDSEMDLNGANKDGDTPLYLACLNRSKEIIKLLLDANVNVGTINKDGETALTIACKNQDYDVIEMLIAAKANVDIASKDGDSLLQIAAVNGDDKLTELLLDANVNINASNKDGESALFLAAARGYHKIVELLAKTGKVNLDASNGKANTALHMAYLNKHEKTIDVLIKYGANQNLGNMFGKIPREMVQ